MPIIVHDLLACWAQQWIIWLGHAAWPLMLCSAAVIAASSSDNVIYALLLGHAAYAGPWPGPGGRPNCNWLAHAGRGRLFLQLHFGGRKEMLWRPCYFCLWLAGLCMLAEHFNSHILQQHFGRPVRLYTEILMTILLLAQHFSSCLRIFVEHMYAMYG